MFVSLLPSTAVGQQLIAGVCLVAFVLACLGYRRLRDQNRRISTALNNMSRAGSHYPAQCSLRSYVMPPKRWSVQSPTCG